jgi:HlyD family secretion protein
MTRIGRRSLWLLLFPLVLAAVLMGMRARGSPLRYTTTPVDRGDVAEVVGATGVLQAVVTVQVGSQVSGTISHLFADFNSTVTKGQVIAKLEPSVFLARVSQAEANLAAARANVDKSQAAIDDARQKYYRARELARDDLVPASDLESAKATYQEAVAQNRASQAAVEQAEASLNQARVDLDHTVITAPIDGVVLARNVDIGQTVAASFQAPVLFVIANDLRHMQVNASVDEADVGRVHPGEEVTFGVDAFPEEVFAGRVEQVRLQPVTTQNVVTYNTIISVDNESGKLMPGMTATVSVIVRREESALRVPSAALRFRPEGFQDARASGWGATGASPATPGSRRGGASGSGASARSPGGSPTPESGAAPGSEPRPSSRGRPALVFVPGAGGAPEARAVRLGLSDGRYVVVRDGLQEGEPVVTGIAEEGTVGPTASASGTNPFRPTRFRPRAR